MQRRVALIILDGWGLAPAGPTNAISVARTPNFDHLWSVFPHTTLGASGVSVGLPAGQMGNSEVGHMTIGAGRVNLQDLPLINTSIADGSFFHNKVLKKAFDECKKSGKKMHFVGLVSPGGVHSHEKHLYALLEMAKHEGVHYVFVHAITDGRDVGPRSGIDSIKHLEKTIKAIGVGKIATVSGRYYSMDRDQRWDRTEMAYAAIVGGRGEFAESTSSAIQKSYELGVGDEFIKPTIIDATGMVSAGDTVIFFNFRSDRPRQLASALIRTDFTDFDRRKSPKNLKLITFTEYEESLPVTGIVFPFEKIQQTLSDVIADHGLTQFHIAETEKYAHVTYYFDGGNESIEQGEDRKMIPSPKVATYDEKPEMSAFLIGEELEKRIGKYDFIIANFANADMVGHTGKLKAAVLAIEAVDKVLGQVADKAYEAGYDVIVTADHGNAEKMVEADGSPCTSHTTSRVPFILAAPNSHARFKAAEPTLANIAPTVLSLLGLPKPKEMTGKSLIK
jgi:2,3-bisphosphoglycerate-independent phosphoglycerate mutase